MDIVEKSNAETKAYLQVDHLSLDTVRRALEAPTAVKLHFWSEPVRNDITRYAANHHNDPGRDFLCDLATVTFVAAFSHHILESEVFERDSKNIIVKDHQMMSLIAITCHKWREASSKIGVGSTEIPKPTCEIVIPVLIGDRETAIKLREVHWAKDGKPGILETFDGNEILVENLAQHEVQEKFEADIARKLLDQAEKFLDSSTLPNIKINGQPEIKAMKCPGEVDFVQIHAGTAHRFENQCRDTADSATIVTFDGMLAATVVDGNHDYARSFNSRIYSTLITAAALHTVKCAVLENGLTGDELRRYFFDTIKLLDKQEDVFQGTGLEQQYNEISFGGVVLYFDWEGKQKKFVYGLGDTAVALRTINTNVKTLHFQSLIIQYDFLDHKKNVSYIPTLSILQKNTSEIMKAIVTAEVLDVAKTDESIQIMTGCNTFYAPDQVSFQPCPNGKVKQYMCKKSLPQHGKFDPQILLSPSEEAGDNGDDVLHVSINVKEAFKTMSDLRNSM